MGDKEDYVGTWLHDETTLEMREDGTYTITEAPSYLLVDGTGEWTVANTTGEGWVYVGGRQLWTGEDPAGGIVVFFGLRMGSDDPRCFVLVREGSPTEAEGPDKCWLRG